MMILKNEFFFLILDFDEKMKTFRDIFADNFFFLESDTVSIFSLR